ncbi:hypothetical protein Dd703_2014 [Musicola paradisiaca Ech703]|uniref:Uncharacterized protein n=1 Tax=Musicola paradisiaca (strain Ech703) TaxID=579405 RepID=C6C613_MUSP7|nr:hypothetical protein Dd703_2014 [Musicola paradisiaca Ech703]
MPSLPSRDYFIRARPMPVPSADTLAPEYGNVWVFLSWLHI